MSEALKERKEMDPQYQWDLTKMYASDAEWEKAFAAIDPKIEALAAWEGKLNNAASIREFYDAEIGVFRELENLAVYTSLRLSEDTRADDAQICKGCRYHRLCSAGNPGTAAGNPGCHHG